MEKRRYIAVPRALVWAALVVFTLYIGIRLAAGPGRDSTFDAVTWTGGAIAQVVVLTIVLAAVFARAAYLTYRTEIAAPPAGTVILSGARMGVVADAFLAIVGGLLMLLALFMVLHIPEAILAGNTAQYRNYARVSLAPNLLIGALFGGLGFVLMILRRYVWVLAAGRPIVRYWARPFSRGHVARGLELYWTYWYVRQGAGPVVTKVPAAQWLRARDPASAGFFRDCDLELVPLNAAPEQLRAIEQAWQQRFSQLAGVIPPVVTVKAA